MHLSCQSVFCATALKAATAIHNIWHRLKDYIFNNEVCIHLNKTINVWWHRKKEASVLIEWDLSTAGSWQDECDHQHEPPTHTHTWCCMTFPVLWEGEGTLTDTSKVVCRKNIDAHTHIRYWKCTNTGKTLLAHRTHGHIFVSIFLSHRLAATHTSIHTGSYFAMRMSFCEPLSRPGKATLQRTVWIRGF